MLLEQLKVYMQKSLPRQRSDTSHKLKVNYRPKCKIPSNEISDGNIKQNLYNFGLAMSFQIHYQ